MSSSPASGISGLFRKGEYVVTKRGVLGAKVRDGEESPLIARLRRERGTGQVVGRVSAVTGTMVEVEVIKWGEELVMGLDIRQTFHQRYLTLLTREAFERLVSIPIPSRAGQHPLSPTAMRRTDHETKPASEPMSSSRTRRRRRGTGVVLTSRFVEGTPGISRVDRYVKEVVEEQSKAMGRSIEEGTVRVRESMLGDGVFVFGLGRHLLNGLVVKVLPNNMLHIAILDGQYTASLQHITISPLPAAHKELVMLVENKQVEVVVEGVDSAGRLEVSMSLGSIQVQERLVRLGLAKVVMSPQNSHLAQIQELLEWEKKAQRIGLGMWGEGGGGEGERDAMEDEGEVFVAVESTKAFRTNYSINMMRKAGGS